MKKLLFLLIALNSFLVYAQKEPTLAKTPPMGWNSWNKFGCNVSEKLIKEMADAFVANGFQDAGYEYIIIDDCWQVSRDTFGNIIADKDRFPSGIKALADYIHSKGLKFGIYSDAGTKTCAGRPGGYNHEEIDAKQYAAWGVDYLKYDWCSTEGINPKDVYPKMSKALKETGRPIVFSMCEWGASNPWYWAKGVGNLWRTTGDIQDCWDCKKEWGGMGWTLILDQQEGLGKFAGPGHWNDPDMLEVGNGGMNEKEYCAHFSFWCLLAAPLLAGNDLRDMTESTKEILLNKEAIAIDQDELGIEGSKKLDEGNFEVWTKPLKNGDLALILFNRGGVSIDVNVTWDKLGIKGNFKARDLWKKSDLGISKGFKGNLDSHSVLFYRLIKQSK
jgi:alpha-galactosidase